MANQTLKFVPIAAATAGDNVLLAALASGKKIRVMHLFLIAGTAANIYFTSGAAGTVIFGGSTNKIQIPAGGGFVLPSGKDGWFEAALNTALVLNSSSVGPLSGGFSYVEHE